jgi:hypothetical protein
MNAGRPSCGSIGANIYIMKYPACGKYVKICTYKRVSIITSNISLAYFSI